jgi:hypothetical protein
MLIFDFDTREAVFLSLETAGVRLPYYIYLGCEPQQGVDDIYIWSRLLYFFVQYNFSNN